jgi:hypothetical protein
VFLRFASSFIFACIFSLNEGFAGGGHNKENEPPIQNLPSTPVKRKRIPSEGKGENRAPHKHRRIDPTGAELRHWEDTRANLALAEHINGQKIRNFVPSPDARRILGCDEGISLYHQAFYKIIEFEGKTVWQPKKRLYDPYGIVFINKHKWETNLERMHRGCAPVSLKATKTRILNSLPVKEILKLQNKAGIQLHHLSQKDTGETTDPIVEMTNELHMGGTARFILEKNPETNEGCIRYLNLSKERVGQLLRPQTQFSVSNIFHYRKGPSLINRVDDFDPWREEYWKAYAAEIENDSVRRELFPSEGD